MHKVLGLYLQYANLKLKRVRGKRVISPNPKEAPGA
jgi:hypothetical protein